MPLYFEVFEKPRKPLSNLAIVALYVFKPTIYQAIEKTEPNISGEVQLTDAISLLLNQWYTVYAVKLKENEERIDIGSPETYLETLKRQISRL